MNETPEQFLDRAGSVLIGNYARQPVEMVRGRGSRLWDSRGREFIDLFAGFGGGILGHCHPELVAAAVEQATQLWHVGNTYHTHPQVEFAERLKKHAFDGRAFFCHSGLEANEAAVKLARLRGLANGGKRWKTVSLIKSFHGRSLAMIAATGNPDVKAGFGPPVPGFANVDPNDWDAIVRAVDDETAAILMEPIQGEGGINVFATDHVARIRKLCDDQGITLIFDEVWCCGGRTGRWFGHQWFETSAAPAGTADSLSPQALAFRAPGARSACITPDIMTLGKAVGGGLPVGVMWARPEIAALMIPGKHGCTLGGNPICMAVARTIFDVIEREGLVGRAARLGDVVIDRLRNTPSIASKVKDVRGHGLFLGIELNDEPKEFIARGLEAGVILNVTYKKILRIAPAIDIPEADLHEGIARLIRVIEAS
jgi:acetylornithine/succinyldiaminopimelate/putrescine aminotransferase